jgi:hypothetical protein
MRPWLDRLLDPSVAVARKVQDSLIDPATRIIATNVEPFWPPITAIVIGILLQASLPERVGQLRWIFVALSAALLVVVAFVNPRQIERRHKPLRGVMLVLVAALSLGNAISGAQLVIDLLNRKGISDAGTLLRTGGAIWLTNVIVCSLWYWLFDRGGPYARAQQDDPFPRSCSRGWTRSGTHGRSGSPSTSTASTSHSPTRWRSAPPTSCRSSTGRRHDARAVARLADGRDPGRRARRQHPPAQLSPSIDVGTVVDGARVVGGVVVGAVVVTSAKRGSAFGVVVGVTAGVVVVAAVVVGAGSRGAAVGAGASGATWNSAGWSAATAGPGATVDVTARGDGAPSPDGRRSTPMNSPPSTASPITSNAIARRAPAGPITGSLSRRRQRSRTEDTSW